MLSFRAKPRQLGCWTTGGSGFNFRQVSFNDNTQESCGGNPDYLSVDTLQVCVIRSSQRPLPVQHT